MHWMSVKLPDNFQMREHSWPCRFHIIVYLFSDHLAPFGGQSHSDLIVDYLPYFPSLKLMIQHSPEGFIRIRVLFYIRGHSMVKKNILHSRDFSHIVLFTLQFIKYIVGVSVSDRWCFCINFTWIDNYVTSLILSY